MLSLATAAEVGAVAVVDGREPCVPTVIAVVDSAAVPPASVAVPRATPLSMNVTVPPVGVAALGAAAVTVAVSITDWP